MSFPDVRSYFASIGLPKVANCIVTLTGPAGHREMQIAVLPPPDGEVLPDGELDRAALGLGRTILGWVQSTGDELWDEEAVVRRLGLKALEKIKRTKNKKA